jgi:DEAD/DEAH box helicase domain-containing protein
MSLSTLLANWRETPSLADNIAAWKTFPARPGEFLPFPANLHPALVAALEARGIGALYTHQAAAWQHLQAGEHPVIVTGTASGKSLCYNLPILNHVLRDTEARALYLFPTKALAQDQAEALRQLVAEATANSQQSTVNGQWSMAVATYDGDTPTSARPAIRQKARLVITNPDMLHAGILPHHTRWAGFFSRLRFVVIDEMHLYRGVFGSHVANVLRRLKRVALFYGAAPQFILTSATLANPGELAEGLIEAPVTLVEHDGAAKGAKHFLIYNPPVVDHELGLRRSTLQEAVRLTQELLAHQVQTIVFGRARRSVEMVLKYLRTSPLTPISPSPPAPLLLGEGLGVRSKTLYAKSGVLSINIKYLSIRSPCI